LPDEHSNEPAPDSGGGLIRVRLDLAYDGTDFHGWAKQPGLRTVQEELETAMRVVCRLDGLATVTCAGRTDSGVHARGQVAHVDLPADSWSAIADQLAYRLRGYLPADVTVRSARQAPAGFDARFSALSRTYTYWIADRPELVDPLRRHEVLALRYPLDLDPMNDAARSLRGRHDFAAFCKPRDFATTIRTVLELGWDRDSAGCARLTITADAFCHSMVRSLVGAMLRVGQGREIPAWLGDYLAGRTRTQEVAVAPARGLVLESVAYPPDSELAERAEFTRRRRDVAHLL